MTAIQHNHLQHKSNQPETDQQKGPFTLRTGPRLLSKSGLGCRLYGEHEGVGGNAGQDEAQPIIGWED